MMHRLDFEGGERIQTGWSPPVVRLDPVLPTLLGPIHSANETYSLSRESSLRMRSAATATGRIGRSDGCKGRKEAYSFFAGG
jgi:hypothetical protein